MISNDKQHTDMDLEKSYSSTDLPHFPIDRTEKGMKPEVPECDCFGPGNYSFLMNFYTDTTSNSCKI